MSEPRYGMGLVIGRFQPLHKGHEYIINTALVNCRRVCVFVGSAQESGTDRNPFTYELRKEMLERIFGTQIEVLPLPDAFVKSPDVWGEYVLTSALKCFGCIPDVLISAPEERRTHWLDNEIGKRVKLVTPPKLPDISAFNLRRLISEDNREAWQACTNPLLWDMYPALRAIICSR